MEKKNKVLIATSVLAILAVGGISVGVTTALFSQKTKSKVHINAGSLDVGFFMTKMEYDIINDEGIVETKTIIEDDLKTKYGAEVYSETYKGVDLSLYEGDFTIEKLYPTMGGKLSFLVVDLSDIAINVTMDGTKTGQMYVKETATYRDMTEQELAMLEVTTPWLTETLVKKGASITGDVTFTLSGDAGDTFQLCKYSINTIINATQVVKSSD